MSEREVDTVPVESGNAEPMAEQQTADEPLTREDREEAAPMMGQEQPAHETSLPDSQGETDGGVGTDMREARATEADTPGTQAAEREAARPQGTSSSNGGGDERAPLLPQDDADRFRGRWEDLQTGFVDRPREMVQEADGLVGELMQQLTAGFNDERSSLEAQWEKGDEVSTEELRVALKRYRSFFNRLLSA